MGNSAINKINLGVPAYVTTFADGNLAAGILTVTHNLNAQYLSVTIYDNNDKIIIPDDVTATSANVSTIDLSSYGTIASTWRVVILDTGATAYINPIATDLNLTGQADGDRVVFDGSNWVRKEACLFSAYMVGNQVISTTGVFEVVGFNNEDFDIGSNFNTTTHLFTAPVTGYYQFNLAAFIGSPQTNVNNLTLCFSRDAASTIEHSTAYYFNGITLTTALTRWPLNLSYLCYMTASESIGGYVRYTGTTGTTYIDDGSSTEAATKFSGYLIA